MIYDSILKKPFQYHNAKVLDIAHTSTKIDLSTGEIWFTEIIYKPRGHPPKRTKVIHRIDGPAVFNEKTKSISWCWLDSDYPLNVWLKILKNVGISPDKEMITYYVLMSG